MLLTASDTRADVPSVGNGARTPVSSVEPAHRLIEQRAHATPRAIALELAGVTLTYGELNAAANRFARHLGSLGIGRESRVVVAAEPGFDAVITLLGILKAGAVYVPIDPGYPARRLRAILADITPSLIVAPSHLVSEAFEGTPVFRPDLDAAGLQALSADDAGISIDPDQTAYIYYTSGTSGTPKGVMATQGNLAHYVGVARDRYEFTERDVMPAIARFTFSISMFELLTPLIAGGRLLLLARADVTDVAQMARTLERVTIFHAGPALLRGILGYVRLHYRDFAPFAQVRHASSGGDMVPPDLLEAMKEVFANAEVFVIYGCSEISCMGCTWPVDRAAPTTRTYVGSPFRGVEVRVFDEQRRSVPPGVIGEIHFAGPGVVKGYVDGDKRNAGKFFTFEGRRFYATGDVGRMSPAGDLEILGRKDFQIQLRGMRIELGDVEAALRKAPGVRDGVVSARDDAIGGKMLVAYVVFDAGANPDVDAVREHMSAHVPDYMVPSLYVPLPALPLNENMKVDRHALPAPPAVVPRAWSVVEFRPAESATERALAAIWARLLGVSAVGLDDNFFELGGHSLLAIEAVLETKRQLGADLAGIEMLREPLEVLARLVDRRSGATPKSTPPLPRQRIERVESMYFGTGNSLYGSLYGTPSHATERAVVICTSPGQEQVRAAFVLTKLARHLATAGVPVLQFDPFGTGNSLGENVDADVDRWRRDIVDAGAELRRRAPNAKLSAVGVRLGAAILAEFGSGDFESRVYWDPVLDGAAYLDQLSAMHRARLRSMRVHWLSRRIRQRHDARELLGFTYSTKALAQIRDIVLDPPDQDATNSEAWLFTHGAPAARGGNATVTQLDFDCRWDDVDSIDDGLADVGITSGLAHLLRSAWHE